jgi:hypothetical protein
MWSVPRRTEYTASQEVGWVVPADSATGPCRLAPSAHV